jgi:hypothetical protein
MQLYQGGKSGRVPRLGLAKQLAFLVIHGRIISYLL